mmetsp:Transcript_31075/g.80616  ORF Transcript_31075/g.80616 Transcript_31075/m.80616 type:complete len:235 (+) Transcript_31075:820-1524(+)
MSSVVIRFPVDARLRVRGLCSKSYPVRSGTTSERSLQQRPSRHPRLCADKIAVEAAAASAGGDKRAAEPQSSKRPLWTVVAVLLADLAHLALQVERIRAPLGSNGCKISFTSASVAARPWVAVTEPPRNREVTAQRNSRLSIFDSSLRSWNPGFLGRGTMDAPHHWDQNDFSRRTLASGSAPSGNSSVQSTTAKNVDSRSPRNCRPRGRRWFLTKENAPSAPTRKEDRSRCVAP